MKKIAMLALMLTVVFSVTAAGYKSVFVTLKGGGVSQINLTDNMKTTFDEVNVVFSDGTYLMEIEKILVNKFEFSETVGIDEVTVPAPSIEAGVLTLQGLPANSRVAIYTVSGVSVHQAVFSDTYSVNLNDFASGVYIVNVNGVSFKIAVTK